MRHKSAMIHIRLDEPTRRRLRVRTAERGETIQQFVEALIERGLHEAKSLGDVRATYRESTEGAASVTNAVGHRQFVDTSGLPSREAEVLAELAQADWSFVDAQTQEHVHGLHPYPAKFIPQIPRRLIQALHPRDGSVTLDPFCGSGTTLVESLLMGIPAIGIDSNPLAVLLSNVKTRPLGVPLEGIIAQILEDASDLSGQDPIVPDFPRLDHWFDRDASKTIAVLLECIDRRGVNEETKDALRVALSAILVRVSRQESDVRYAAIDKTVDRETVLSLYRRSALEVSRRLSVAYGGPLFREIPQAGVLVVRSDTRELYREMPSWNVGLLITSPPYPNAYEYWLYHKYRMYWLGMDPIEARREEIGARPFYSKRNGLTGDDFKMDLDLCFKSFSGLMRKGRYACFVMGNSRIRGEVVDNVEILSGVAQRAGFSVRALIPRRISASRRTFNPSLGSISDESTVVLRRE